MGYPFAVFNVLLYSSFGYLYFFNAHLIPVRPLYWYVLTIGVALGTALLRQQIMPPTRASRRLATWALAFTTVIGLGFGWSSQSHMAAQALITGCEAMVLLVAFLQIFREPAAATMASKAMVAVTIIGVALNVVDYFLPSIWQFTNVPGRAAGLYENANLSGSYLVLGMVIAVWQVPRAWRIAYCVVIGLGVLLTFSRSAMILWAVAVFMLAWYRQFPWSRSTSVLMVGGVVVAVALAIVLGQLTGVLEAVGLRGRLDANTMARLTGSFFGQRDQSTVGRLYIAQQGLKALMESPFIGIGTGGTEEWRAGGGTHNLFVRFGAELGAAGLLLLGWLVFTLWRAGTPLARMVAVLFVITSMFTHNSLDEPAMMIVLALGVLAEDERKLHDRNVGRLMRDFGFGSSHPSGGPYRPGSTFRDSGRI